MSNRADRKSLSNGYDVLEESQSTGSNHLDIMVIKAYKPYIHKLSYKPYIVLVQAQANTNVMNMIHPSEAL